MVGVVSAVEEDRCARDAASDDLRAWPRGPNGRAGRLMEDWTPGWLSLTVEDTKGRVADTDRIWNATARLGTFCGNAAG